MRIFWLIKFAILIISIYSFNILSEVAPAYGKKGEWYKAHLTWYQSYPDDGSEECVKFNGCEYAGRFAFIDYQKSEKWVRENNIISVHSEHSKWLRLEQLRLRINPEDEKSEIIGTVYDYCSDTDCGGCCSRNANETGYLIDLEINTLRRMGYTKDDYPYYIYFKVYETKKEKLKREVKEIKKEIREKDRAIKKEMKNLKGQ